MITQHSRGFLLLVPDSSLIFPPFLLFLFHIQILSSDFIRRKKSGKDDHCLEALLHFLIFSPFQVEEGRKWSRKGTKEGRREGERRGNEGSRKDSRPLGSYCLKLEVREELPAHFSEKQNPRGCPGASCGDTFLSRKVSGGRGRCAGWWDHTDCTLQTGGRPTAIGSGEEEGRGGNLPRTVAGGRGQGQIRGCENREFKQEVEE